MSGKRIRHPGLNESVYFRLDCRSGGSGFDFDVKHIKKNRHLSFNVDYFGNNFPTHGWELCEDEESKQFEYKTESGHQPLLTRISGK